MNPSFPSRRRFLEQTLGAATATTLARALVPAGAALTASSHAAERSSPLLLSTNAYSWHVFYQREGRDFGADLDSGFAAIRECDIDAYEPSAGSAEEVTRLAPLLRKHGLQMPSLYVNSTLHTPEEADRSHDRILAIAEAARVLGTRIIVTNPNPIQWGGAQAKDDTQLRCQAGAMERLGGALRDLGMVLAYHNHDIELRQAAREFHHMMAGTDPARVQLCLDAHWIFRGSENSQVALFDVVRLYGSRVAEVHLRQSTAGTWSETLGPGDIDYARLASALLAAKARPLWVLEIAVEKGTPKTLSTIDAHRQSARFARETFAAFRS